MSHEEWIEKAMDGVAGRLRACNQCRLTRKGKRGPYELPSRHAVQDVLESLLGILFPGCHGRAPAAGDEVSLDEELRTTAESLQKQARMAFEFRCEMHECKNCDDCGFQARAAAGSLVKALPQLQDVLQEDIRAAYDGDPAANSAMEVVMSYPAILAIATYRIAHVLYENRVPLIPRIMTEFAHSRTGIDIHPGATIGSRFFIDHGTGVVVGETSVIGRNVKMYQGVTLGALSFPKDEDGNPVKGIKRHPNVQDNVTIYAEATILGDITIGAGSVIGGNVWLTHSVPPDSRVNNQQPAPDIREKKRDRRAQDVWYPMI